jgi:hypothetical protein
MATMLPATNHPQALISDVADNIYRALTGEVSPWGWKPVKKVALVIVDGLGAHNVADHSGHARTIAGLLRHQQSTCSSGLPSTTSSALASLTTGRLAGEHGMLGYSIRDGESGQLVNHLKPFPHGIEPERWQPIETIFERLEKVSIPSCAAGEARFANTDFSRAILRGSTFAPSNSLDTHLHTMRQFFDSSDSGLCYLYWPGLDRAGHSYGVSSPAWVDELEAVDSWVRNLQEALRPGEAAVVTGDHGMVNVGEGDRVILPASHPLRSDIAVFAGEPRMLHLYANDGVNVAGFVAGVSDWVGQRGIVLGRADAISSQVFGPVSSDHEARVGDAVVFARETWALYDEATSSPSSIAMVGQHGSLTDVETAVPLVRLGDWAV